MLIGIILLVIWVCCIIKKTDKHNRLLHEYITNEYGEKILLVAPKNILFEHLRSQDTIKMNTSIKMPGENDNTYAEHPTDNNERIALQKLDKLKINSQINEIDEFQNYQKQISFYPKSPLDSFNQTYSLFSYNYQESKNHIINRQTSNVMDFSRHDTLAPSGTEFSESYEISKDEEIEEVIPFIKKSKLLSQKSLKK